MPWPWEDLSLVDRFWLLTAGVHPITRPTPSVRFGMAMAAIRTIERAGEIRWVGRDEHARLLAIADCRCPQPLRGWHDALQADQPRDLDGVAARFALDPLLRTPGSTRPNTSSASAWSPSNGAGSAPSAATATPSPTCPNCDDVAATSSS